MKKSLFALSVLFAAFAHASEENTIVATETPVVAEVVEVATPVEAIVNAVEEVVAPVVEVVNSAVENVNAAIEVVNVAIENVAQAEEVAAPSKLSQVRNKISNGALFVKDGAVKCVASVQSNVVYAYDVTTGTIEKYTPSFVLEARDSVRNVIATYPLTAVAVTAFVAVKASNYFSSSEEENEDDLF